MAIGDAAQTLAAAGYQTAHFWSYSTFDDLNVVVRQEPRGGADLAPPALVTYWIGAGPPDPEDPHRPPVILKR
jgi:beta-lactam-binding protein with PASTA domain